MQLYTKITIGLVAGALVGIAVNVAGIADTAFWQTTALPFMDFVGNLFIRAIMMIVIPLVVASLVVGVASLGDTKTLGRMGGKTVGYYLFTTSIAITIGLLLALTIRPGAWLSAEARDSIAADFEEQATGAVGIAEEAPTILETLLNLLPNNPVAAAADGNLLPLIIFTIIFAAAFARLVPSRKETILNFFHGINDAAMIVIHWIMKTAPYAVFALIAAVISRFGLEVLQSLAIYVVVVIVGLLLHAAFTYGTLVSLLGRINPLEFFRRVREAQLIGFSTSSSNATLPVTMDVAEHKLGVSNSTASFVLPLGATVNMDGTALYQGVATVFIAQVYGFDLGLAGLLTIILTATLASIGTAGVPSAGIIILVLVLNSVGLGAEAAAGIALILGVDRILDMIRTAVNITGDLSASVVIGRSEGESFDVLPQESAPEPAARS